MTSYEMEIIARKTAEYLAGHIKEDEKLLDQVFPPEYLDAAEAAQYLRISKGTLHNKIKEIPHTMFGSKPLFTKRSLTRYLQETRM